MLSTKVGRYGDSTFDFSAERVTASIGESMARLNVSYIDLVLCHDVEFVDLDQIINETLPGARAHGLLRCTLRVLTPHASASAPCAFVTWT